MPKTLQFTVGRGVAHQATQDVITVQYLLNCVPAARGGPPRELQLTGVADPDTLAAIERFQGAVGLKVDGRVEPSSTTLLGLQQHDPLPFQALPGTSAAQFNPKELTVDKSVPWPTRK